MSLNLIIFVNSIQNDVKKYWFGNNYWKFRILGISKDTIKYQGVDYYYNNIYYSKKHLTNHNLYIKDNVLYWEYVNKQTNKKRIDKYKILEKIKN